MSATTNKPQTAVEKYRELEARRDAAMRRKSNHLQESAAWAQKQMKDPLHTELPALLTGVDLDGLTKAVAVAVRHLAQHRTTLTREDRRVLGLPIIDRD